MPKQLAQASITTDAHLNICQLASHISQLDHIKLFLQLVCRTIRSELQVNYSEKSKKKADSNFKSQFYT